MNQEICFTRYSDERVKFYSKLADFKVKNCDLSPELHLDINFFSKVNTDFASFFEKRSQKKRLSNSDSKICKEQLNSFHPEILSFYNYNGPAIYWFKINHQDNATNTTLLKKYLSVKKGKPGWWWSRPRKESDNQSEYLYVGKVEKNLHNRFREHIGLGHVKTSSLKLTHWFHKFEKTKLTFQYLKVDPEYIPFLEDIENVIWRQFDPIIGAEPRIK